MIDVLFGALKNIMLIILFFIKWILPVLAVISLWYLTRITYYYIIYKKSNYKFESGIGFIKFYLDKGYFGEALTFMELEKIGSYGKIMTNIYIPTEDGTTEIDLLYISKNGIYVIESKNYSGWIFGSENHKDWIEVIYNYKTKFSNPIWQNRKHVKYLKKIIDVSMNSVIVFSERCKLKKINYNKEKTKILNRQNITNYIEIQNKKNINTVLSNEKIDEIYNLLKIYALKSKKEKEKHINYINQI